jgi:hypothetical protein
VLQAAANDWPGYWPAPWQAVTVTVRVTAVPVTVTVTVTSGLTVNRDRDFKSSHCANTVNSIMIKRELRDLPWTPSRRAAPPSDRAAATVGLPVQVCKTLTPAIECQQVNLKPESLRLSPPSRRGGGRSGLRDSASPSRRDSRQAKCQCLRVGRRDSESHGLPLACPAVAP